MAGSGVGQARRERHLCCIPWRTASGRAGAQDGAGTPDGFQRLWMPHRLAYIKGEGKPAGASAVEGCPF